MAKSIRTVVNNAFTENMFLTHTETIISERVVKNIQAEIRTRFLRERVQNELAVEPSELLEWLMEKDKYGK